MEKKQKPEKTEPKPAEPKPEEPKEPAPPKSTPPSAETPEVPMGTPEPAEGEVPIGTPEPTEGDSRSITADDFKKIMTKVFDKAKLIDLAEITPKMEKMTAELEKMKAHIDAVKEQKNTDTDRASRINEELGELRSGFHTNEGRLSEMEMKVKDHDITLSDLKPQKYSKSIQGIDSTLKMHDGRLDKHDDLTSMIMKRISGIKDILEQFGSMEQVARMNNDISKKLISIDEREKRIKRISDKLDGIFSELNKRLDEFIFYKAKQDNVGELVDELLRNIDEMGTKLSKFAGKTDLELLRDNLEGRIAAMGTSKTTVSPEEQKLQSQKDELTGLISLLEEQHSKKSMSDAEYEKAKTENTKRIQEIDEKIAALGSASTPTAAPTDTPDSTSPTETKEEEPEEKPGEEPTGEQPEEKPKEEVEELPEQPEEPKEETPKKEPDEKESQEEPREPKKEQEEKPEEPKEKGGLGSITGSILKKLGSIKPKEEEPKEKPGEEPTKESPEEQAEEPKEKPSEKKEEPKKEQEETPEEQKEETPKKEPDEKKSQEEPKEPKEESEKPEEQPRKTPKEKPKSKKTPKSENPAKKVKLTMLETLEESFKKGLITKESYEKTKKILEKT